MDDSESPTRVTINGRVTNGNGATTNATDGLSPSAGLTKATSPVEGAVVSAASVDAEGTTTELSGEATTNADGTFTLEVEDERAADVVLVKAQKESADFTGRLLVNMNGENTVDAPDLTTETTAETAVYMEAKAEDGSDDAPVTLADVAARTDAGLATAIDAGTASAADVATALHAAVQAEAAYLAETNSEVDMQAVTEAKHRTYLDLQSALAAATSAEARANAIAAFEEDLANVFVEAGTSAEVQAKTHQAGTSVAIEASGTLNSSAQNSFHQRAELLRAYATAKAIEARFEAENASQAMLDSLAAARADLVASIRTDASQLAEAKANYRAEVEAAMERTLGAGDAAITAAKISIGSALETLRTTIDGSATTTVDAYVTFYSSAESTAESTFNTNGTSKAGAAATVLVLVSAF